MNTIAIVCFFTAFIHFSETLALSMRLAGARTKQVATSISFVNTAFLGARMSNMLQAPLLGALVDSAVRSNSAEALIQNFRYIIFAAFIGNVLGALLLPTGAKIFEEGILVFEKTASIPKLIREAFRWHNFKAILRSFRLPSFRSFTNIHWKRIPHLFIYLNAFMVSVYAIGVLASLAAGALLPQLRATATQLSGIVNGIATVLLVIMVDPTGAHIVDKIVKGERPVDDARTMVFYLVLGRILGTLIISQIIFSPAVKYIMAVTKWVASIFSY
ncbi:lipid II flippase family protein [Candidatus Margulisiibacteriota bacterium]